MQPDLTMASVSDEASPSTGKLTGKLTLKTRPNSPARAALKDQEQRIAPQRNLYNLSQRTPGVAETDRQRKSRRDSGIGAGENQALNPFRPQGTRQIDFKERGQIDSYAKQLIDAGYVYVVKRDPGKNWLVDHDIPSYLRASAPTTWKHVVAMLLHPSRHGLGDKGRPSTHAHGKNDDESLHEYIRKAPTDVETFQEDVPGYMKFFFESVGPEELVLVSFHEDITYNKRSHR